MKRLILGGVKSGKSRYAEQQAELVMANNSASSICLLATAQALDEEMAARIERHKADRPDHWCVIEEPLELAKVLEERAGEDIVLVVDCLTLWVTNLLMLEDKTRVQLELDRFVEAVSLTNVELILVSNETNMGIMPLGDLSRKYCDVAGLLHQSLASLCDQVDLVVAGLPLSLKPNANNKPGSS